MIVRRKSCKNIGALCKFAYRVRTPAKTREKGIDRPEDAKEAEPTSGSASCSWCYAMAKMMDATVPRIITIATIRLKILRPLLIVSLPHPYLPIEA